MIKRILVLLVIVAGPLLALRAPGPVGQAARAVSRRLRAELRPVLAGVLKEPEKDAAVGQPSADRLSAPTLPARQRSQTGDTGPGRKAPLLNDKGIAMDQEMRPAMDAPVLLDRNEDSFVKTPIAKFIGVMLGLALFFCLWAWYRGDPNAKTLT